MPDPIRPHPDGVAVDVLVVPNASRAVVIGLHGDRIKVKVASPPNKGKANAAVLELIEETLGARRCQVLAGRTTRSKTILVPGKDVDSVRNLLV